MSAIGLSIKRDLLCPDPCIPDKTAPSVHVSRQGRMDSGVETNERLLADSSKRRGRFNHERG